MMQFRKKRAHPLKNAKNRKTSPVCGEKPAFSRFFAHK
jgi:hypothetical protein